MRELRSRFIARARDLPAAPSRILPILHLQRIAYRLHELGKNYLLRSIGPGAYPGVVKVPPDRGLAEWTPLVIIHLDLREVCC